MPDEKDLTPEEEALLRPTRAPRRSNLPTRQVSLNPAVSKRAQAQRPTRKPVSPKEFELRKARSEKRDAVLLEKQKLQRLESSAEDWHKLVGPRFQDAETDNPIILNRANRILIGSDAPTSVIMHGAQLGSGKTWLGYAYINEAIKIGAATPGQIRAGTENAILGRIAVAGWQRADFMMDLLDSKYKIYFIDDVGLGYFGAGNSEQSRQQVWYELINHVYMHDLTLILTTNKEIASNGLGSWVGDQAYDRLRALVGKGGLIEPGHVNRRPGIAEAREEKARNGNGTNRRR